MNPKFMREAVRLSREKMRRGAGGPVGAVVGGIGGAEIGNSMTNHRHYRHGYGYHPYHHEYIQ